MSSAIAIQSEKSLACVTSRVARALLPPHVRCGTQLHPAAAPTACAMLSRTAARLVSRGSRLTACARRHESVGACPAAASHRIASKPCPPARPRAPARAQPRLSALPRLMRFAATTVPIIDLRAVQEGSAAGKLQLAQQINDACERIGFIVVVNHGVPQRTIDEMWKSTRDYFDLPVSAKREVVMTPTYPYGYSGFGEEVLSKGRDKEKGTSSSGKADLKESFSMGPYNPASGSPPIQWPKQPASFQRTWLEYYKAMEVLSGRLLGLFALALDLPENWFEDKTDRHRSALRALCVLRPRPCPPAHVCSWHRRSLTHHVRVHRRNYPDLAQAPEPGQLRASAHSDYGSLTILRQENAPGGLEVLARAGEWQPVTTPDNAFVINLGDLMARWTNDRWVSTLHRVAVPPADKFGSCRRQSAAFFHNINADHLVTCIETCTSPTNPPKYPPIPAFEHLMQKHLASTGY